jgi:hypothetical protein
MGFKKKSYSSDMIYGGVAPYCQHNAELAMFFLFLFFLVDLFAHHQQYDLRTPFPLSMKDV